MAALAISGKNYMPSFEEEFKSARIALVEAKKIKVEFCTLFYNEENQAIIEDTAINFFKLIYSEFRESLVVKLCKLSDPAVQGRNRNLTAEYILQKNEVIEAHNYERIKSIYEDKILPLRESMNWYRNKYLIHSDLETLQTLEGEKPSDKEIIDFYEAVNEFYNEVSLGVLQVTIMSEFLNYNSGASYLMHLLSKAKNG